MRITVQIAETRNDFKEKESLPTLAVSARMSQGKGNICFLGHLSGSYESL